MRVVFVAVEDVPGGDVELELIDMLEALSLVAGGEVRSVSTIAGGEVVGVFASGETARTPTEWPSVGTVHDPFRPTTLAGVSIPQLMAELQRRAADG